MLKSNYSISPRNNVELVNQKIDNAKKKISRYFQAKTGQTTGNGLGGSFAVKNKNQNSLTHLSMDMVRLGSPFFGQNIQN